jgi:diguanylate cyclase (GGDEF)-like protein
MSADPRDQPERPGHRDGVLAAVPAIAGLQESAALAAPQRPSGGISHGPAFDRRSPETRPGGLVKGGVRDKEVEALLRPLPELAVSLATAMALAGMTAALLPGLDDTALGRAAFLKLATAATALAVLQGFLALRRQGKAREALALVDMRARRRGTSDPLTGLANRSGFYLLVEEALNSRPEDRPVGVVYIDLDRFKEVNDNFGHEMGDKLLCAVTGRLREIAKDRATGARLGGDEFALVVNGCSTEEEILAIGELISKRMGQPFMIDRVELVIGGSVGIAIAPEDGLEFSELVRRADISMYRAKAAGRGTCFRFDSSMEDNARRKKVMESALRHAIERDEMRMVYQPFFAADGETIRGVEALVRWLNPELGIVSPTDFIPLAEETGLIGPIGEWTVRRTLEDAQSWPDIDIAVNVSPAQFRGKGVAQSIIGIVKEMAIEPRRVEIEVTEGVLIRDAEKAAATIKEFHDAGMRVALDDFGTGFASLSYLRRFQFDKLKIDQVFVKTLSAERGGGSGSAAIIHNVVALGRSLGMTVQAEGVETLEHHIFLRAAGCHCLQGYYFSRPMEKADFDLFLAQKRGLGYESRYYA